jgi:hypothetical protein
MFGSNTKKRLKEVEDALLNSNEALKEKSIQVETLENSLNKVTSDNRTLRELYQPLIKLDDEIKKKQEYLGILKQNLQELDETYIGAHQIYNELQKEIELYKDTLEIQEYGLYEPQFNFDTSQQFELVLKQNYDKQKSLIKNEQAVICPMTWEVSGSKVEGRRMTNQYKKLMLYAFNGECDSVISKAKWNNATKSRERISKAFATINKLGITHHVEITSEFLNVKLEEFFLTFEYEQKKYFEKEEQRRIREQMREEEKAQRDLERAEKEAAEEESRYQKALHRAKQELETSTGAVNVEVLKSQITVLENKLKEAQDKKERALSMAQQTKIGHIYVISNLGSFGENIFKIGMTRRLDPLDRVHELGDASVPFKFDIHAIIYSENAPQLEYEIHKHFQENRLNKVNSRKEFFKTSLEEIESLIRSKISAAIEFTKLAEAREYRETLASFVTKEVPINSSKQFPSSLIN